jgi:hypothetical protein
MLCDMGWLRTSHFKLVGCIWFRRERTSLVVAVLPLPSLRKTASSPVPVGHEGLFHRLHLGGSKDKDRDNSNNQPPKEKEKFPPLPSWPPQPAQRPTSAVTSNSITTFKPLPEIVPSQIAPLLPSRPLQTDPDTPEPESTAAVSPPKVTPTPSQSDDTTQLSSAASTVVEQAARSSRKTNVSTATGATDVHKKVAFISPPPTPLNLDQPLPPMSNSGTSPQPRWAFKDHCVAFSSHLRQGTARFCLLTCFVFKNRHSQCKQDGCQVYYNQGRISLYPEII